MLLKDLPSDSLDIDWSIHMPLMLHIALLGMDHSRPLIHQHCKQLLLNLLLVLANNSDQLTIAQVLLNRDSVRLSLGLPTPPVPVAQHNFTGKSRCELNGEFITRNGPPINPFPVIGCRLITSETTCVTNKRELTP